MNTLRSKLPEGAQPVTVVRRRERENGDFLGVFDWLIRYEQSGSFALLGMDGQVRTCPGTPNESEVAAAPCQ